MRLEAKTEKESDGGRAKSSTCLTVIGDITYTNNEAVDDNILCMTSVFAKAVLTQRNGTLNHPHCDAPTHLNAHARGKFHFAFSSPMSDKVRDYKEGGDEETQGHFRMMGVRLVYQSIYNRLKDRRKCRCRLLVSLSPPRHTAF